MKPSTAHRIALLFNANKSFDREVIAGISAHLAASNASWDLFLEEDFRTRLCGIERWRGGIIADFDDPAVAALLARSSIPVVAVGGSYHDDDDYPAGIPYVATDNAQLVKQGYDHLREAGLRQFAMFSLPEATANRWAQEREHAFGDLMRRDNMAVEIFRGQGNSVASCSAAAEQLMIWLRGLPKPIGIIGVTDARVRQLLQACILADIYVPEEVALIGIDNDPLARGLTRIPLSSVIHGSHEIGRLAAHTLEQMLAGVNVGAPRLLVPPAGICASASSQHQPVKRPQVMRARHFIRQYACKGIKAEQVADFVGISRSSLETYFREELNRSVHEEILRFKLEEAMTLLASPTASMTDIAFRCGFNSEQYMRHVFKRELGCAPGAWPNGLQRPLLH